MKKSEKTPTEAYAQLLAALLKAEERGNILLNELLDGVAVIRKPHSNMLLIRWGDGSATFGEGSDGQNMDEYAAFTDAFARRVLGRGRLEDLMDELAIKMK